VGKSINSGAAVKSAVGWPVNNADFCPSRRHVPLHNVTVRAGSPRSGLPPLQAFHTALSDLTAHSGPRKSSFARHKPELSSVLSSIFYMVQPILDPPSPPFAQQLFKLSLHSPQWTSFVTSDVWQQPINLPGRSPSTGRKHEAATFTDNSLVWPRPLWNSAFF